MAGKRQKKPKAGRRAAKKPGLPGGVIALIAVVAVLAVATLGLCTYVHFYDDVYPGVRVDGLMLGGMTKSEAASALRAAGVVSEQDETLTVQLPQDNTLTLSAQKAGALLDGETAAGIALAYGRDGGFFENGFAWLRCAAFDTRLTLKDVKASVTLDEAYIRAEIKEAALRADEALMGSNMDLGETQLQLVKGIGKVLVDEEALYTMVTDAMRRGDYAALSYTPEVSADDGLDLTVLYETVYREKADAFYTKEDGVTAHVVGRDFDLAAAQKLWDAAAPGETVTIPLIVTEPEITGEYLEEKLFADELGKRTTGLGTSSKNRLNNVQLACAAIDGLVLMPGEEFSYNEALGERTVARGYKGAGAYLNGEVVTEVGGGICQVSSTLYVAALYANLKITDRTCHYFGVDYLPAGLDATVSWGGPEFKFVNSRAWPIMLRASVDVDAWKMTVSVYGTDEDGSYVELTTGSWEEEDGYSAVSYRWVYDKDGNLLSKTQEAKSRYYYHKEDEEEEEGTPSPSPEVSPEVSPEPEETEKPEESEKPEEEKPEESEKPEETPSSATDIPKPTPEPEEPVTPPEEAE